MTTRDIATAISRIKPTVAACSEQDSAEGLANLRVTIANSGKVSNVQVTGKFAGTPTGDCVVRAVRGAPFPRFKGGPVTLNYSFTLTGCSAGKGAVVDENTPLPVWIIPTWRRPNAPTPETRASLTDAGTGGSADAAPDAH
jgi:hypothetical protein